MAVPAYYELIPLFMECLQDGQIHPLKEIRNHCARRTSLTEDDLQVTTASGLSLFFDRVGWARTYLKKAGLIESPSRSNFRLTDEGRKAVDGGAQQVTLQYLMQYDSFMQFYRPQRKNDSVQNGANASRVEPQSPQEILSEALKDIHASLADDLMTEVMKLSPSEFEMLVVKLLVKMGYGSGIGGHALVTRKSGDEGIDGVVTADRFGFDAVYVQAKQWKNDSVVGRPEIQKFLGALAGQGATKGVYMTTAHFSKEAQQFAEKQLHSKIVLVDGTKLTDLMIEYGLGVSVMATYEIKRVDYDFFNEDM